ncbi:MAG: UTP--glucose-1-phosphate uridylyltransferase [Clostridia bacterium]
MIKKAVIPAAGLGTRMLPLTKTQPKEMLPLGAKPCIHYIVEELAAVGVEQILFITGSNKRALEDYFDKNIQLNNLLFSSGQTDILEKLEYENMEMQYFYTRQSAPSGLGDAISHAKNFIGGQPFIIALGDSVIVSGENPSLLGRMLGQFENNPESLVIGTRPVPLEEVSRYGIVAPKGDVLQDICEITDVVEKPSPKSTPSTRAFCARYILPGSIFDALERTSPGKSGEIQLTDAIRLLLKEGTRGYCVNMKESEKRYDLGNMSSYFEAFLDFALEDEKYGYQMRQYVINKMNL